MARPGRVVTKARPVEVTEKTLVQVDHCHMTCDDIAGKPKLTILVAAENRHGEVLSLLDRKKGLSDEYVVKAFAVWVDAAGQRTAHCEVRCGTRHWRRCEGGGVQKRNEDRTAAVTKEVERCSGDCRGIQLRSREPAQENEAWAARQVPAVNKWAGKTGWWHGW